MLNRTDATGSNGSALTEYEGATKWKMSFKSVIDQVLRIIFSNLQVLTLRFVIFTIQRMHAARGLTLYQTYLISQIQRACLPL